MVPETHGKTGRPPKGNTTMSAQVKVRLEPGLAQRLNAASRKLHVPRTELVRNAIRLYLERLEQYTGKDYY